MFDIGGVELLVIAAVAILVVGPRELPGMLRGIGNIVRQLRSVTGSVQRQFNDALKEAELDDVKKTIDDVRSLNPATQIRKTIAKEMKPLTDVGDTLKSAVDEVGTVGKASASTSARTTAAGGAATASAAPRASSLTSVAQAKKAAAAKSASDAAAKKPAPAAAKADQEPAPVKKAAPRKSAAKTATAKTPAAKKPAAKKPAAKKPAAKKPATKKPATKAVAAPADEA